MQKLRVGIIGCGKAGRYHAYWYKNNPNCILTGFYNRTRQKAEYLSKRYDAKVYDNWKELAGDPGIDIISICTPVFQHKEQASHALTSMKHVLCEKPMACSSEECRHMIDKSKKSGTNLGVFFNMRFNPVAEAVDKNIHRIGKILNIDMSFQFHREDLGWRGDSSSGVLLELGTHAVDLSIHWAGDIECVKANISNYLPDSSCDDHAYAIFRFKEGASGKLYTTYNDPGLYDQQIEGLIGQILGEDGKLNFLLNSYDPKKNRVFIVKNTRCKEIPLEDSEKYDEIYPGHMDSFGKLIDSFVISIINDRKFTPSGIDGLKTIKFVEDAFKSSDWGK